MNEPLIRRGDRIQFNTATKFNGLRGTVIYKDEEGKRPVFLVTLDNAPLDSRFTTAHHEDMLRLSKGPETMAYPQSRGAFGGLTKFEIFFKDIVVGICSSAAPGQIPEDSIINRAHSIATKAINKLETGS